MTERQAVDSVDKIYGKVRCTCSNGVVCEADKMWNVENKQRQHRFVSVEERLTFTLLRLKNVYSIEPTKYRRWRINQVEKQIAALQRHNS